MQKLIKQYIEARKREKELWEQLKKELSELLQYIERMRTDLNGGKK